MDQSIAWVGSLNPVRNGEQVNATVTNRLPLQVAQRTAAIEQLVNAKNAGRALMDKNARVASDVEVGHAVYWDTTEQLYKKAIVAVVLSPVAGGFVISESSYVQGICAAKLTNTAGDILLEGLIGQFNFINGAGVKGNEPEQGGQYFLSATVAGTYTRMRPPIAISVVFLYGNCSGAVRPEPRDLLDSHVHLAYDLYAEPAGTIECPAVPEAKYTFITPDSSRPGWLPATDPIFAGLAPTGAKYGYNLSAHPELERVWPPIPPDSAYLELDGIGVNQLDFLVDQNGLWWFQDCYGKAPWPIAPPCAVDSSSSATPSSSSAGSSSSGGAACDAGPSLKQMGFVYTDPTTCRMRIFFTKMVFKTNNALVTSLRPAAGSPIEVLNCDGLPGTVGDLQLALRLIFDVDTGAGGYQVLKTIDGTTFQQGPVVEGVKAGSFVTITAVPGQSEVGPDGFIKGKCVISASLPGGNQLDVPIALVALNNALEQTINGVFFLQLISNTVNGLLGRIDIPPDLLIANPTMVLSFRLLGPNPGTLPALDLSYLRLLAPDGCDAQTLPSAYTDLDPLPFCTLDGANQYVEVSSESFVVAAGDQVFFNLTRNAPDGYPVDMGVLLMRATIVPGV